MSWGNLILAGFCGAGAAAALSYCSNISKKDIFWGAVVGGLGWFVYSLLIPNGGKAGTESYFWGSIAVALLSEVLAFLKKNLTFSGPYLISRTGLKGLLNIYLFSRITLIRSEYLSVFLFFSINF